MKAYNLHSYLYDSFRLSQLRDEMQHIVTLHAMCKWSLPRVAEINAEMTAIQVRTKAYEQKPENRGE